MAVYYMSLLTASTNSSGRIISTETAHWNFCVSQVKKKKKKWKRNKQIFPEVAKTSWN